MAVQQINDDADSKAKNFTFKCHRGDTSAPNDIYAVNAMCACPSFLKLTDYDTALPFTF